MGQRYRRMEGQKPRPVCVVHTGPQRENFPGGTKVDTGSQILLPPKPYRGPRR